MGRLHSLRLSLIDSYVRLPHSYLGICRPQLKASTDAKSKCKAQSSKHQTQVLRYASAIKRSCFVVIFMLAGLPSTILTLSPSFSTRKLSSVIDGSFTSIFSKALVNKS